MRLREALDLSPVYMAHTRAGQYALTVDYNPNFERAAYTCMVGFFRKHPLDGTLRDTVEEAEAYYTTYEGYDAATWQPARKKVHLS